MPLFSDTNGFPESGFPVLTNESDKLVLNTFISVFKKLIKKYSKPYICVCQGIK